LVRRLQRYADRRLCCRPYPLCLGLLDRAWRRRERQIGDIQQQRRGLRAYPVWAIILLALGWAVIAATLVYAMDLLVPVMTGDIYGRWVMLASKFSFTGP
jgi:hypothetical protein